VRNTRGLIGLFAFLLFALVNAPARADVAVPVNITLDPVTKLARIPDDFLGFGYETSAVAQPGFFAAGNSRMVHLYQNLTPHGLIRIGGNVSDHTMYDPDGAVVVNAQNKVTVINRACLTDLGGFAKASGWSVMWGLNLGTGTKQMAVDEAVAVDQALGTSLQSFQIGNEVDFLPNFKHKYDAYHAAWADYKSGVREKLPHAVFSGPDVANSLPFFEQFVTDESADMLTATHHYYRSDMSDKRATMDFLLAHDDAFDKRLDKLRVACEPHHIPFRINEVNSFSGGGKPSVSDTFASALWVLDYSFTLASHGCAGVNIETDINHRAFISWYSPIVHDEKMICAARPEYYGLLAFAMASHGDLIKTTCDKSDLNLSTYATRAADGTTWLVVINKDLKSDAAVEAAIPEGTKSAEAFRLTAPAIDSKTDTAFAGATVGDDGTWHPGKGEPVLVTGRTVHVTVPHATAALIKIIGQ
jgi:hypothetical protein